MNSDPEKFGRQSYASSSSEASSDGMENEYWSESWSECPSHSTVEQRLSQGGDQLESFAKIHMASEALIIFKIPTTEGEEPRIAVVFADNTIRVFVAKTLELIGCVIDLQTEASVVGICAIDSNTIVTGGSDGHLIASDVLTGRISKKIKAHEDAVIAVDSFRGYVVSVARDRKMYLTCFSFGMKLEHSRSLPYMPSGVKFAFGNGALDIAVMSQVNVWFYRAMDLDSTYPPDKHELHPGSPSGQFPVAYRLVDVIFNDSRTHYAAVIDGTSCLRIVSGNLLSSHHRETGNCVLNTGKNDYSKSKFALSSAGNDLRVADNDGAVCYVRVTVGHSVVSGFVELDAAVSCLQVCCGNDESYLLITGGRDGEIIVWK